jgi:hypothetical protein
MPRKETRSAEDVWRDENAARLQAAAHVVGNPELAERGWPKIKTKAKEQLSELFTELGDGHIGPAAVREPDWGWWWCGLDR